MKRLVCLLSLILAILMLGLPVTATALPTTEPEEPAVPQTNESEVDEADLSHAETVLLYCIETDTVLREKNADAPINPATAVKLMTALVAYERIADRTALITVTNEMVSGISGSYYGFDAGDTASAEDLLKLLLLRKSNDAATILAVAAAGDRASFVEAMNAKAKELGMEHTVFTNCTGIYDSKMTTTATDLLILSLAFSSVNDLQIWSGAAYLKCESLGRTIYNDNFFLSRYYNGTGTSYLYDAVNGLINGKTPEAGEVLITSATYGGMHYIVVLLGGETIDGQPTCYTITKDLLEKDTQNFHYVKVLRDADVICELPVKLGSGADYAAVFPKETLEYYLSKAFDRTKLTKEVNLTVDSLEAPVQEGNLVGTVKVYYDGVLLGETELVVRSNITRSGTEYRLSQITDFLSSKRFLGIALIVIGLFAVYFIANAIYREQVKKKYRRDSE